MTWHFDFHPESLVDVGDGRLVVKTGSKLYFLDGLSGQVLSEIEDFPLLNNAWFQAGDEPGLFYAANSHRVRHLELDENGEAFIRYYYPPSGEALSHFEVDRKHGWMLNHHQGGGIHLDRDRDLVLSAGRNLSRMDMIRDVSHPSLGPIQSHEIAWFHRAGGPAALKLGVIPEAESPSPTVVNLGEDPGLWVSRPHAFSPTIETFDGAPIVSFAWEVVSKPGPVVFESTATLNPTLSFTTPGIHHVRLSVFDGIGHGEDSRPGLSF